MTGGPTWSRVVPPVCVAGLIGVLLAEFLTGSGEFPVAAYARFIADAAGATVLGLAAPPRLNPRIEVRWRLIAVLAGVWFVAEFAQLVADAAEIVGVRAWKLGVRDFATFMTKLSGGQIGIAIAFCTAAIAGYATLAFRRETVQVGRNSRLGDRPTLSPDLVLVFGAVALVLRPVTGHMSQQHFGSVLAAIHTLAAAAWLGLLLAMALTLRGKGAWAATLPKFSDAALPLLGTVALTGVIDAAVRLQGFAPLWETGYGRILIAKVIVLVALLALGWHWRRTWVPKATTHRTPAPVSLRNAVLDAVVIAIAFGLAATLALTA
ncbi:CopD family protein [Nocardia camponoti]|uniref:Copper resistance protein D domain-containing protein n=1 Tax=Nocardia camponoti TaxID=1616106 RepID=A0A917VA90_9NOCA|nr:CopD family protein [Nocardia camponoti]GGK55088.1 hypothetical protein GCM10011591_28780 [Nocardia camponoti]